MKIYQSSGTTFDCASCCVELNQVFGGDVLELLSKSSATEWFRIKESLRTSYICGSHPESAVSGLTEDNIAKKNGFFSSEYNER